MRKKIAVATGLAMAAAGYVTGILTAPKSGKETRKDIKDKALTAKIEAEKRLKKVHSELKDLIEDAENASKKLSGEAKKKLDEAIVKAKDSKDKARDIISALHNGDADDPNLAKAIEEAKAAQKNLVQYLKKR